MPTIRYFRILDCDVGLQFPSEAVANIFCHLLSGFPNLAPPVPPSPYEISQDGDTGVYRVTRDDALLGEFGSLFRLVSHLEWTLIDAALGSAPYLGLHAGAVTHNGRTLLLPGRSGAGKTSLVLGLLLRGWRLLSDEASLVCPDTSAIRGFPRSLYVKSRTTDLFRPLDRCNLRF